MKEFVLCGCSGANIASVKDCVKNQIHPLSWKKWMKCDLCSVQDVDEVEVCFYVWIQCSNYKHIKLLFKWPV